MKKLKKVAKYTSILVLLFLIISAFAIKHLEKQIYGGLTKRVDTELFKAKEGTIAIQNVNVLAPDGEEFIKGQTVLVEDGFITNIDSFINITPTTITVDGKGKYLIPGLTDAHVHLFKSPNDLLLYVANGVTEIRELIGGKDQLTWKKEIENGRIGPRMFVASPRLGSFGTAEGFIMEQSQGFVNCQSAEEAEKIVKDLHSQGYDGLKIYSQLNRESYLAITKTAKALDMPTFGHIPWSVNLSDIYQSGQSGIAHFEEVMNALNREFDHFGGREQAFLKYVEERSDAMADSLIKYDISVTSTLWLTESFVRQEFELERVLNEVELAYQNPGISEWVSFIPGGLGWLPEVNRFGSNDHLTEDEKNGRKQYWTTYAKACQLLAKKFSQRGVKIMAGTDANLPPTVPGFSLHDELQSLNRAGISTIETLKSATSTPATWLKSNSGRIEKGYDANLVLLDKNPLEDIKNTRAINSVILKGQLLDRKLLDEMLESVKVANDVSRTVDISSYEGDKMLTITDSF